MAVLAEECTFPTPYGDPSKVLRNPAFTASFSGVPLPFWATLVDENKGNLKLVFSYEWCHLVMPASQVHHPYHCGLFHFLRPESGTALCFQPQRSHQAPSY